MLIEAHVENTGSARGKEVLGDWDNYLPKFVRLVTQGMKMRAAAEALAAATKEGSDTGSPRGERAVVAA
jgi:glutamate synthase domain-containing protein 3